MTSEHAKPHSFKTETSAPVTITMVTYNREDIALRCLQELRHVTETPFHLTVVDNGSAPAMQEKLQELYATGHINSLFLHTRNMGVSVAANTGWESTDSPYYVKCDSDILVKNPHWLANLLDLQQDGQFWAVAYKLCAWHGTTLTKLASGRQYNETGAVGGGCILIPRTTFENIGFWNEDYVYGWEDLEYGNRIVLAEGTLAYTESYESYMDHLGAEADYNLPDHYQKTKNQRAETTEGPKSLFQLNTTMFELGLRPINVIRKFVPAFTPDGHVTYKMNPDYKSIVVRQNIFRQQLIKKVDGEDVFLDLPFLSSNNQ